ncbi:hypothetical protein HMSSN036_37940 [Paenibacillus macerans]|nr:hypothetical protein HMSSN036_37940 [Paenibacillus macerans]
MKQTRKYLFMQALMKKQKNFGNGDQKIIISVVNTLIQQANFSKILLQGMYQHLKLVATPIIITFFWDKQSHFYIDGNTRVSKTIPVLKYDTASGKYSSFKKIKQDDGSFVWREYAIK